MSNSWFQFKQFTIHQDRCAMKVTTDSCLFGGWTAERVRSWESGVGSQEPKVRRTLDIGTGSGLLALMLAQKTIAPIDAIEMDQDAYEQAKENIGNSPWPERIKIFHTDARNFSLPSPFDIIISNPPFYEKELRSPDTKKNLAQHEGLALDELLKIIKKNLYHEGLFYLLLPYKRNSEIDKLVATNHLSIIQKTLVRQSVNHDYFRVMIAGKNPKDEKEMIIDEISICSEDGKYTNTFISLLKDYYLYL